MTSGDSYELACGSWGCPLCGWRKKKAAVIVVLNGIQRAWASGQRVRFLTLTDGTDGAGDMDVADFYVAWNRFRVKMKRRGYLEEFCACLETQERGALHLHVLLTGRKWLAQKKWAEEAIAAGFGLITDIREVKPGLEGSDKRSAYYVAKDMAGYVSKEKADALDAKIALRKRPLRQSRNWSALSFKEAEDKALMNDKQRRYDPEALKAARELKKPYAMIKAYEYAYKVKFPEEFGDFTLWDRNDFSELSELGLLPLAS